MTTFAEICSAMEKALHNPVVGTKIRRNLNAVISFVVNNETFDLNACNTTNQDSTITTTTTTTTTTPPELTIIMSQQTLNDLIYKRITPQRAFMNGSVQAKGKMSLAMKLHLILDATRKQLDPVMSRL